MSQAGYTSPAFWRQFRAVAMQQQQQQQQRERRRL